jgi:hypothetical protein
MKTNLSAANQNFKDSNLHFNCLAEDGENNDMIEYFIQNIQMLAETDTNFHDNIVREKCNIR